MVSRVGDARASSSVRRVAADMRRDDPAVADQSGKELRPMADAGLDVSGVALGRGS
jgi:hypothetical protein